MLLGLAAYGCFLLGEELHVSGVLAPPAAGMPGTGAWRPSQPARTGCAGQRRLWRRGLLDLHLWADCADLAAQECGKLALPTKVAFVPSIAAVECELPSFEA